MNSLMILWYVNLILVAVGVIVTARTIYDAVSENTPEIKKVLAPSFAIWSATTTICGALFLYMPLSLLGTEYIQPKFGWVILSILAAIFVTWKLGCFTPEKTNEDGFDSLENRARRKVNGKKLRDEGKKFFLHRKWAAEEVAGVDPTKPTLTEKAPVVDNSTPATTGYWAGVSSWRQRDFKGSLVQWLRDNGPKSHLIPATQELCESLNLGSPYWNKNIVYGSEGVSLTIWDKKFFFRWEDLVFHVEYNLYDHSTVEVSETSITLKPARTFHLLAKDGTEISWDWSDRSAPLGNFEVELKFPKKVTFHGEDYVFEYQDGMSGYYGENIPVYYFASDLAKLEREEEDRVLAEEMKGRKKS